MRPQFDERDEELCRRNMEEYDKLPGPRVGDWVIFADGIERRISYIWKFDDEPKVYGIQTSQEGYGFHLGFGYISFSGSLFNSVDGNTLTRTYQKRNGRIWMFHHGFAMAHNGVETTVPFRVYCCSESAPK